MTRYLAHGLFLFMVACDADVKSSHYLTIEDARRDSLFKQGWLPDILPPSAQDINVSNNLDINTSAGDFKFNATDYQLLVSQLRPKAHATGTTDRGSYHQDEYSKGGYRWVFSCSKDKGHCQFEMGPSQNDG
jgi:hypothetical protein